MQTRHDVRTKVVATIGPASDSPESLAALLDSGVDVCRLNFSHGTLADHQRVLERIRAWSTERGEHIAVLGDLCGPKIRLSHVESQPFTLRVGDMVRFERGDAPCNPERLTTSLPTFIDEVDVGQRVYIDDGLVRLLVIDRTPDALTARCTVGGTVSSRKGVNLPDTRLSLPALTEKDRRDLDWAIAVGLDYLALSFVRTPRDVQDLADQIAQRKADVGIIVKVEKLEAIEHLDALVALSDGVMVARGDLGVEMDVWQVPLMQKSIIARCRAAGKSVIVATQMLQSMIASPMPTRAEVSDVANAILDSADAIMLSAETAAGQFPLAAVEMMQRVAAATEAYRAHATGAAEWSGPEDGVSVNRRVTAVAHGAVHAAAHLHARLIAVWSATGETVRSITQHRLPIPVVGMTFDARVCRRMNLRYGVIPMLVEPISNPVDLAGVAEGRLLAAGLVRRGDLIVLVSSRQPTKPGETDTMLVHRIGGA